jgi:hypothetical protein
MYEKIIKALEKEKADAVEMAEKAHSKRKTQKKAA